MRKHQWFARAAVMPALFAAGLWAGMGGAGQAAEGAAPLGFTATLGAAQEVPKPKGVAVGAQGSFTAGLVRSGAGGRLSWRLTFKGLSGTATASHIHLGRRGRSGAVSVALCGPCRTGARGSANVSAKTVAALLAGGAYVNVHTARNKSGEIRGQIARTAKPPAPPPTTGTTGTTETTVPTDTYG
jgi:CHRD domain-containing protein